MPIATHVSFRNCQSSPGILEAIQKGVERLERVFDSISLCEVMVEAPHRHHHKGKLYHVRIDLKVPGRELVVARNPSQHLEHSDLFIAIRDSFLAARRQLDEYRRIRRGHVKAHPLAPIPPAGPAAPELGWTEGAASTFEYAQGT